jgi:hypothetical protein
MSGLKMVKGKKVVVKATKKADLPEVPDQDVVCTPTKGAKATKVTKSDKPVKAPKEKTEKVYKVTRTGRMGEYLNERAYTDEQIYAKLDEEFGEGKRYLATYRHNLNVKALENDANADLLVRLVEVDGKVVPYEKGLTASAKKEPAEAKKAKILLAVKGLPKK